MSTATQDAAIARTRAAFEDDPRVLAMWEYPSEIEADYRDYYARELGVIVPNIT